MNVKITIATLAAVHAAATASAQGTRPRPEETEVYKPVPAVVTPGRVDSDAPSDAIRLFDGRSLSEWVSTKDHSPARWDVHDGVVTVNKSAGNIETRRTFTNYQLHLEWRVPENISGTGQSRGNSGVFLAAAGPGDDGY
jgi:hypothetical protein